MAQARQGDTVKVHYTGKLKDGTVFDSSEGRDPLEFTIGEGRIIPGFEQAVVGMNPGDSKIAEVAPENAYGPHRREMVVEVNRDEFPADFDAEVGQQLQIHKEDGGNVIVMVTHTTKSTLTLDANHPLAGKDLSFELELVEIA